MAHQAWNINQKEMVVLLVFLKWYQNIREDATKPVFFEWTTSYQVVGSFINK